MNSTPAGDAAPAQTQSQAASGHEAPFSPFRYHPDGSSPRFRSPDCTPEKIATLMTQASNVGAQADRSAAFFKSCHDELAFFGKTDWEALLEAVSTDYDVCDNAQIRQIVIHLPDGNKVRGLLAIKPPDAKGYSKPRPLVLVQAGVFENSITSSNKMMIMHFFDEGPFNVLALESNTGTQYVADNRHVALGGLDEGMQLIEIAQALQKSSLGSQISSFHVVGISLGGNTALFSSYLNAFNFQADKKPYFKSVLALCPVVDLQASIDNLFSGKVRGGWARNLFITYFTDVLKSIPELSDIVPKVKNTSPDQVPDIVAKGAIKYYSQVPADWGVPPFKGLRMKNFDELWQDNNFIRYAGEETQTPTLVFGAKDDWLVDAHQNSMALHSALQAHSAQGSQVKTVIVGRGNHCAFAPSFGWDVYSSFLKSYLLSYSPELIRSKRLQRASFPTQWLSKFARPDGSRGESYAAVHFEFKAKSVKASIRFDIVDADHVSDPNCDGNNSMLSDMCLRSATIRVPLDNLPKWARFTKTRADADSLTRWANANVRFLTAQNESINYNSDAPAVMTWTEY